MVVIAVAQPERALSLLLVAALGVATIASDSRFELERRLEDVGLPSREAWVPLAMLVGLHASGLVDADRLGGVVREHGPVIAFILSFALLAEGLRRSGFFHFVAYQLAERGGGNTSRLTLYLFLLSSFLAYFASSDVVVLVMTPIVLSVAYQASMGDATLLLLSQFVAANTASMGLLTGSPANLVLGRALGLGFIEYLVLMFLPSLVAVMAAAVFVTWISGVVERRAHDHRRVRRWFLRAWSFSPTYVPSRFAAYQSFTVQMRRWVILFALGLALFAVGSGSGTGLLLSAVVVGIVSVGYLRRDARLADLPTGASFVGLTLRILPLGVVFFGLTFFAITDAMAREPIVQEEVAGTAADRGSAHSPVRSWASLLTTGGLVATVTDLPASALIGEVLPGAQDEMATPFDRALLAQSALVGLNIGAFLLPAGSFSALIWFGILRKERQLWLLRQAARLGGRQPDLGGGQPLNVVVPTRGDLLVYGTITFLALTAVLGATNFALVAVANMVSGPLDGGTPFATGGGYHVWWTAAGLVVALAVVGTFVRTLRRHGIAVSDLSQFFIRLSLWVARHRLLAGTAAFALVFTGVVALLYHVESFHAREYGTASRFESPGEFVNWLMVVLLSLESDRFPRSALGNVLIALLVVGGVATLAGLVRLSRRDVGDRGFRNRLARGEIGLVQRLVVVNGVWEDLGLVAMFAHETTRFVTVVTRDPRLARQLPINPNVAVMHYDDCGPDLAAGLRLNEARELILLGRSNADGFDNLGILESIDALGEPPSGPAGGDRSEGLYPAVILQQPGPELAQLVESRVSSELAPLVVHAPLAAVVRRFVVASAAGSIAGMRRVYADPHAGRAVPDDVDRFVSIHGAELWLTVGPPLDSGTTPSPPSDVVGYQVEIAGRSDWRPLTARQPNEIARPLTGTVRLGPPQLPAAAIPEIPDTCRAAVHVIGGDSLAQHCALDLAAAGVGRVTLLTAATDPLLPGVSSAEDLAVHRCRDEVEAIETLAAGHQTTDEAVLVVDSLAGTFDTSRLLELLSIERLHKESLGEPSPAVHVCCRGADRERRIRSFVVDEVVDATWVETSYFRIFTTVYHHVLAVYESTAEWALPRRLAVADHIASQLCHLDVGPAGWAAFPDRFANGIIRFEVVDDDWGGSTVHVSIQAPLPADDGLLWMDPTALPFRLHCL